MPVKFLGLQFWAVTHFHGPVFLLRHLSRTSIILPSILSTVWPLLTSFFNSISFSWLFSCLSSISLIKIPLDFLLPWACWALLFLGYEVILLSYLLPIPCSPLPIFLPLSLPPSSLHFPLPLSISLWISISKCPFSPFRSYLEEIQFTLNWASLQLHVVFWFLENAHQLWKQASQFCFINIGIPFRTSLSFLNNQTS